VILVHWIFAILFMFCFVLIAAGNAIGVLRATREHGYTLLPFLGGVFCVFGLSLLPIHSDRWFLLALLDLGTSGMIWMPLALIAIVIWRIPKLLRHERTGENAQQAEGPTSSAPPQE